MLPSLVTTKSHSINEINKLETILDGLGNTPAQLQYMISEIILIRSASILEQFISEVAYKISSGALYIDGSSPLILFPCKSVSAARQAMLSHGRQKPVTGLKWTKSKFINESTKYVIDRNDNFISTCQNFSTVISEIFKVRNYAAHRNKTSKNEFKEVIRSVYLRERNIQLGNFLLSENYVQTANLKRYIIQSKVLMSDITKS